MNETPETPETFASVSQMARWISDNPENNGATPEWWRHTAAYVATLEADRDALRERAEEAERACQHAVDYHRTYVDESGVVAITLQSYALIKAVTLASLPPEQQVPSGT